MSKLMIGCVADDFTGASDAASFLTAQGMKTLLYSGIPTGTVEDCAAVVIALKSRTQETSAAVADSMTAFRWLHSQGATHLYFKYCSTFDSTPEGNIGPVVDGLLEEFDVPYTILSPALPVNGRTVADGILYVNGVPLGESPMKHHPLTPMWASSLAQLMEPQGKYPCLCLNSQSLHRPDAEIYREISEFSDKNQKFYIIPDYQSESDGTRVAQLFSQCKILTGGSGILAPLAQAYLGEVTQLPPLQSGTPGRCLLLAGSCSQATLGQIADFQQKGYPSYQIDPIALRNGGDNVQKIWDFVASQGDSPVLIYSSDTPENIKKIQQEGGQDMADLLEKTAAELACLALASGYTRLIVAGGETSSAVVQKLGFQGFQIGESVSPGVPIMAPLQNKALRVVLKSGNFGQVDFFHRAVLLTKT